METAFDPFAAVAAGMVLAIAAARLSSAPPGRRLRPAATVALAALAFVAPVVVLAGTPVVVLDPRRILLGAFGVLLGARVARDQAMIAEATEPILRRRALRGVLLALPFALIALSAAIRDTTGESGEDMFYRIILVILPCSLVAAWFGSGALAPGWAWIRSRGRAAD